MTGSSEVREICVIGLGNMGSALAEALLANSQGVTVWNRTASEVRRARRGRRGCCRIRC